MSVVHIARSAVNICGQDERPSDSFQHYQNSRIAWSRGPSDVSDMLTRAVHKFSPIVALPCHRASCTYTRPTCTRSLWPGVRYFVTHFGARRIPWIAAPGHGSGTPSRRIFSVVCLPALNILRWDRKFFGSSLFFSNHMILFL